MTDSNSKGAGHTIRDPAFKDTRKEDINQEGIKQWLYFTDRPVATDSRDAIWSSKDDLVHRQLRDIAQQVVQSLTGPSESDRNGSEGLTFAVFGEWGAGKSSFLRLLKEYVYRLAADKRDRIVFCDYIASSYAHLAVDVRLTLGIRVLNALEVDVEHFNRSEDHHQQRRDEPDVVRMHHDTEDLEKLATEVTRLVGFPSYISRVLQGIEENNGIRRILVIMIDDLDRCPLDFVVRVLKTTQEWTEVPNLFFVLAINPEWLSKAVKTLGGLESEAEFDYAVEKYVQHTVRLPVLEGQRLESYVKTLLSGFGDQVSRVIVDNAVYIQKGLRFKTPRAVKRILNFIRPHLKSRLEDASMGNDQRLLIKELVLRYSWPEFYNGHFSRSVMGTTRRSLRAAFGELEAACLAYEREASDLQQDPDDAKLDFSLQRIGGKFGVEHLKAQIPTDLVYFLAQEPYWVYKPSAEDFSYGRSIPAKPTGYDFDVDLDEMEADIDGEFMRLYAAGRAQEDPAQQLRLYSEAAQLAASHQNELPDHRADEIGNMALAAERLRVYPLADNLFRLALSVKANHPNNIQNYVSFILDAKRQASYDDAERYLEDLEIRFSDFKPERLLLLKAQLSTNRGEPVEVPDDKIGWLVARVEADPMDLELWRRAMIIAADYVKDYELMRKLLELACADDYAESKSYLYRRLRGFADQLSGRKEWGTRRREAMEIYRRLLLEPNGYVLGTEGEADVRHNYATLLYSHDIDDEAGRIWYQAYRLSPGDSSIKSSYSAYLVQAKRSDVMQRVVAEEPIEEMVLLPENAPLPERFSQEAYIDDLFQLMSKLP